MLNEFQTEHTILVDETATSVVFVDEMITEAFGFVEIPEEFARIMGRPDKGTRVFRTEGDHATMRRWFDALCLYIGPCVSPGGAAVYSGASRAGVYKRMKAGGLTAFCFHITGKKKTWLGRDKKLKQWALVYIPVSECKAWGVELDQRAARLEKDRATAADEAAFDEADPSDDDTNPDFLHYDPTDRKSGEVRYTTHVEEPNDDGN